MGQSAEKAKRIVLKLKEKGYEAYLAGGCVRDQLMGRPPKDYDIATSALPEEIQAVFPHTEAVGAQFGVILVIEEGEAFETATFRSDLSYKDGRRPEAVRFTNAKEDALRRDFTVNGMFFDPVNGQVIDYIGGQKDLQAKVIRCIGEPEKRFDEDKLRILRAVRFSAELGFQLEPATKAAIPALASAISQVSWERIGIEMNKLLLCPLRRRGIELLDETGLLAQLLPELLAMKGCGQPPEFHPEGDVWIHTLLLMEKLENPSLELAWAALLHDVGKPATRTQAQGDRVRFNEHDIKSAEMAVEICRRFRLSNETTERIRVLIADHMRINQVEKMRVATLKRLFREEYFDDLLALHLVDCLASHGHRDLYEFCVAKKQELEKLGAEQTLKPKPLINGGDLIRMGFRPGPLFKEVLEAVETEQLEGRITEYEQARLFVSDRYKGRS